MLVSEQGVKSRKRSKLRHCEYYDMQGILDELYFDSKEGKIFENLMEIIKMPENIKLAYRNIKNNLGSTTHGVDKVTISSIKGLKLEEYVDYETLAKARSWVQMSKKINKFLSFSEKQGVGYKCQKK